MSSAQQGSGPARLGVHHFAYLRALVEGIGQVEAAKRYLDVTHAHAAPGAHERLAMLVRAQAKRLGARDWRLIGPRIGLAQPATPAEPSADADAQRLPTLEEWIRNSKSDIAAFGVDEQLANYEEEFGQLPPGGVPAKGDGRDRVKARRRSEVRARQLALIEQLEQALAVAPRPEDPVDAWIEEESAALLAKAGIFHLAQLASAMCDSERWHAGVAGIGPQKAQRLGQLVQSLLPRVFRDAAEARRRAGDANEWELPAAPQGGAGALALPSPAPTRSPTVAEVTTLMTRQVQLPAAAIRAENDAQAVDAWVCARAGSDATHKSYRREATRLLLWLHKERGGLSLADMTAEDCRDYLAFLKSIPTNWIARRGTRPGERGWAPFRGQLTVRSQQHAAVIVASMFGWLVDARYLAQNPWTLVNMNTGDDPAASMLDTKAVSEVAMSAILDAARREPPSPARERFIFLLSFVEAVGLRSAEVLSARLGHFSLLPEGWALQVHGKGAKNRVVMIPQQAVLALEEYLLTRGVADIASAGADMPLVGSARDPSSGIGYQALYDSVQVWIQRSLNGAALSSAERLKVSRASMHWLRHTFGTRAVARDVPLDVIQAQMGHASITTTMSIYGRAPVARRAAELGKAFGAPKIR